MSYARLATATAAQNARRPAHDLSSGVVGSKSRVRSHSGTRTSAYQTTSEVPNDAPVLKLALDLPESSCGEIVVHRSVGGGSGAPSSCCEGRYYGAKVSSRGTQIIPLEHMSGPFPSASSTPSRKHGKGADVSDDAMVRSESASFLTEAADKAEWDTRREVQRLRDEQADHCRQEEALHSRIAQLHSGLKLCLEDAEEASRQSVARDKRMDAMDTMLTNEKKALKQMQRKVEEGMTRLEATLQEQADKQARQHDATLTAIKRGDKAVADELLAKMTELNERLGQNMQSLEEEMFSELRDLVQHFGAQSGGAGDKKSSVEQAADVQGFEQRLQATEVATEQRVAEFACRITAEVATLRQQLQARDATTGVLSEVQNAQERLAVSLGESVASARLELRNGLSEVRSLCETTKESATEAASQLAESAKSELASELRNDMLAFQESMAKQAAEEAKAMHTQLLTSPAPVAETSLVIADVQAEIDRKLVIVVEECTRHLEETLALRKDELQQDMQKQIGSALQQFPVGAADAAGEDKAVAIDKVLKALDERPWLEDVQRQAVSLQLKLQADLEAAIPACLAKLGDGIRGEGDGSASTSKFPHAEGGGGSDEQLSILGGDVKILNEKLGLVTKTTELLQAELRQEVEEMKTRVSNFCEEMVTMVTELHHQPCSGCVEIQSALEESFGQLEELRAEVQPLLADGGNTPARPVVSSTTADAGESAGRAAENAASAPPPPPDDRLSQVLARLDALEGARTAGDPRSPARRSAHQLDDTSSDLITSPTTMSDARGLVGALEDRLDSLREEVTAQVERLEALEEATGPSARLQDKLTELERRNAELSAKICTPAEGDASVPPIVERRLSELSKTQQEHAKTASQHLVQLDERIIAVDKRLHEVVEQLRRDIEAAKGGSVEEAAVSAEARMTAHVSRLGNLEVRVTEMAELLQRCKAQGDELVSLRRSVTDLTGDMLKTQGGADAAYAAATTAVRQVSESTASLERSLKEEISQAQEEVQNEVERVRGALAKQIGTAARRCEGLVDETKQECRGWVEGLLKKLEDLALRTRERIGALAAELRDVNEGRAAEQQTPAEEGTTAAPATYTTQAASRAGQDIEHFREQIEQMRSLTSSLQTTAQQYEARTKSVDDELKALKAIVNNSMNKLGPVWEGGTGVAAQQQPSGVAKSEGVAGSDDDSKSETSSSRTAPPLADAATVESQAPAQTVIRASTVQTVAMERISSSNSALSETSQEGDQSTSSSPHAAG
eukprot:TRINITY_DN15427_c0_g1_i1.p1 TRINITY_DN15427_c0_g1~~TRINITY_DN15427_c0_g1_i1.p1  ORF type:complete len:1256 (+),score=326.30 TRINITY_DN15427_c0_g1_i1:163-3930(+)